MQNLSYREALSHLKVPNRLINSDNRITNKYLISLLRKHRNILIKQLDSRFQLYSLQYLFQTWKCVKLIPVSATEACAGIKSSCKVYRTKHELPEIVTSYTGPIIKRVTSIDGFTTLQKITSEEWIRKLENPNMIKYDKGLYYYIMDNYMYFPNLKWKKIHIEAYFEESIDEYNDCTGIEKNCDPFLDEDFRIPKDLFKTCIDLSNAELLQVYHNLQLDDTDLNKNVNRKN